MKITELQAMTPEAINRLVAERIMGWRQVEDCWVGRILPRPMLIEHWHPFDDDNDMRLVRSEIAKRGLIDAFIRALTPTDNPLWKDAPMPKCNPSNVIDWCLVHADCPRQAIAALLSIEEPR